MGLKDRFKGLLTTTVTARRNLKAAAVAGVIGGAVSAIVKFGWEVPFPPRTPERNETNPPQTLLEQLGMSSEKSHTTVTFNGHELPIFSFIIHFGFAISFGLFYAVFAEIYPGIKLWQGAAFGLLLWAVFHVIVMPIMRTVPAPWDQPFEEHFSEALGHVIWMWSIEVVRRDIRNRITRQPDAEVPLAVAVAR